MERRKYPRFELVIDAKYRVTNSEEAFKFGKTANISAEGICFESDRKFDIGTYVKLAVDLKDKDEPVFLSGEIRWSERVKPPESKDKKYRNGVKLIGLVASDEGRFLKYYCNKIVEKLAGYLVEEEG